VVGGFLLALPVPVIWQAVRLAGTSAFLTNRFVSTPRLWGRRVISLAEVTGVGLRYVPGQRFFTWQLKVWPTDDDSRWIDSSVVVYVKQSERGEPRGLSNRSGFRKRLRPPWDYVPVLDWDYLAQTLQRQAATAIYNQALTVQGPHGPLATQARQRTARSPGSSETAYWSPDGGIGAIRNGEPEALQQTRRKPSLEQFWKPSRICKVAPLAARSHATSGRSGCCTYAAANCEDAPLNSPRSACLVSRLIPWRHAHDSSSVRSRSGRSPCPCQA
jgi:hypothetical protein